MHQISAVASWARFAEGKQFQSEIDIVILVTHDNVRRVISDDQIFSSFKKIWGTPKYFCNMLVDVLARLRQFGVYTFFLTCSVAEFHWTEIIHIGAPQYGETLTNEQVNAMDWSTMANYLKRNPVTVASQIDYVFKELCDKVILSLMHPTVKILNFDNWTKFQNRGKACSKQVKFWVLTTEWSFKIEEMHIPIHIVDAPNVDKTEYNLIVQFIDKSNTCALPVKNKICWNEQFSKESTYLPLYDHLEKVKRFSK